MGNKAGGAALGGMFGGGAGAVAGGAAGTTGISNALYRRNTPYYVDPGERPNYSGYQSIRGADGLISSPALNAHYGGSIADKLDTRGINAYRDVALAKPGESAWEQMARQKQGIEEGTARDRALASGQSRAAEARSTLARGPGLSLGSKERLAKSSMRDILGAQQDVARQGMGQRADIGLNAETQRLQVLSQLPGMELTQLAPQFQERGMQLGTQQFNIQNALAQKQAEEQAKLAEYQEKMRAYAAAQQANAIGAAGPKSGGLFGESGPLGGLFG